MSKLFDFVFRRAEPKEDDGTLYAEWYQSYFEIYCSNCHEEAIMKSDCSDYYYHKKCPHCGATMRNATTLGYGVAITQYYKKKRKMEERNKKMKRG